MNTFYLNKLEDFNYELTSEKFTILYKFRANTEKEEIDRANSYVSSWLASGTVKLNFSPNYNKSTAPAPWVKRVKGEK